MAELPPLNPGRSRGLGSLAQSARSKKLNQARWILIIVGVLTIAVNIFMAVTMREQMQSAANEEIRKHPGMVIDPVKFENLVRLNRVVAIVTVGLGGIFVVLGITVHQFPVPATVIALVLYVGATAIFAVLNPQALLQGIIIKIIIVVALVQSVQAAIAYQKEQAALEPEPEPEYE